MAVGTRGISFFRSPIRGRQLPSIGRRDVRAAGKRLTPATPVVLSFNLATPLTQIRARQRQRMRRLGESVTASGGHDAADFKVRTSGNSCKRPRLSWSRDSGGTYSVQVNGHFSSVRLRLD